MDKRIWPAGIRPSGKGLRIRIWRNRKICYSETIACNPYDASSVAAAVRRRDDLTARARLYLPLFAEDETGNRTLGQAAQKYLNLVDVKRSTSMSYETILNRYWLPSLGSWAVREITTETIEEALAELQVSPKTKKNILIPLRGIFDREKVVPNPAEAITFRKHQKQEVQRYTPKERSKLISHLNGQDRVYFALLFACGLRPGEAIALRWTDYDGEELSIAKQITRRRLENSTKTSMRRKVYVPKWAREFLDTHNTKDADEWIFVNALDEHYRDTDILNQAWRAAHKKAKIPYRVPYVCRHTRAAELLSIGIAPADAAKQLGHSVEMFLRTYSEFIEMYAQRQDKARFEGAGVDKSPPKRRKD
jgi:integrase